MKASITQGTVHGQCPKCKEPFLGQMDTETNQKCESDVEMECVNCHYKATYFYVWPDELPPIKLRKRRKRGSQAGAQDGIHSCSEVQDLPPAPLGVQ